MPKPVEQDTLLEAIVDTFREIVSTWDGFRTDDGDKFGTTKAYEDDTLRITGHHPFTSFVLEFKGDEGSEEYDEKVAIVVYTGPDL